MVKVALVDDEERIRLGLAKLIAQAGSEYEVAGVYASGQELLADLDRIEADLLITDIKMPNMNGLDLIEKLRVLRPKWRLAVLSGFDDFSFARTALRLGVEDYLLKPVDTEELAQLLNKVKISLQKEQERESIRREDHLRLLMFSEPDTVPPHLREEASRELAGTALFQDHFAVFVVHGIRPGLLQEVCSAASAWHREWTAEPWDAGLVALIAAIKEGDDAYTVSELGQTLLQRLPAGFRGRIGAGDVFRGAKWLREAYRQALAAVQHGWYSEGNAVFESYAQLPRSADQSMPAHPVILLTRDFREAVAMQDDARALASLRQWLEDLMRRKPSWAELKSGCETVLAFVKSGKTEGAGQRTEPDSGFLEPQRYPDKESFAASFLKAVEEAFRSIRADKQENRVVETVKAYIQQHYAEELELSRLAEMVYLTPSYLSKLFRTETGETITDYLISVRMDRAKALLRDEHALKTYEVGEKVGYADPAYFNKIFKKVVGCTPKEFRERVR
jgi:two-component system response regulator YesN